MKELKLPLNPLFPLKLIGFSGLFIAAGHLSYLWLRLTPLIAIVFATLLVSLGIFGLVRSIRYIRSPILILNESGLTAHFTPFGPIPWSKITDIGIRGQGIVISVNRSWEYYIGMPLWRRCANTPTMAIPGDLIAIPHGLTKLTTDQLFDTLLSYVKSSDQKHRPGT